MPGYSVLWELRQLFPRNQTQPQTRKVFSLNLTERKWIKRPNSCKIPVEKCELIKASLGAGCPDPWLLEPGQDMTATPTRLVYFPRSLAFQMHLIFVNKALRGYGRLTGRGYYTKEPVKDDRFFKRASHSSGVTSEVQFCASCVNTFFYLHKPVFSSVQGGTMEWQPSRKN